MKAILAPESRTKLYLTVMFIDVVKSTKLFSCNEDEEISDLLNVLKKKCKIIIEKNHGLINQTMGDGLYVVFGLDEENYENQTLLACLSAKEIISSLKNKISIRASIHSGYLTMIESQIDINQATIPLIGETINIAAHNCKVAKPNKILITEDSYTQAKDFIQYKKVTTFKNKDGDIKNIYEVQEIFSTSNKFNFIDRIYKNTPFIGRKNELRELYDAAHSSFIQSSVHTHIIGKAGLGKTRLISALLHNLHKKTPNLKVFSYSSLPYAHDEDNSVNSFISQIVDASDQYQIERTNDNKISIEDAISQLVSLSHKIPVVVIFDDMHWNKDAENKIVSAICSQIKSGKLFFISASRLEFGIRNFMPEKRIALENLKPYETHDLANRLLTPSFNTNKIKDDLCRLSNCNPYHALKIIQHINGLPEGQYHLSMRLPNTLDSIFSFSVKKMDPQTQEVLYACSVLGYQFHISHLEFLTNLSINKILESLNVLKREQFINQIGALNSVYEFSHALARDSIYRSLTHLKKLQLHRRAISLIRSKSEWSKKLKYKLLSMHYISVGDWKEAWLFSYCSGILHVSHTEPQEAQFLFSQSLKALEKDKKISKFKTRRTQSILGSAKALGMLGLMTDAAKCLKMIDVRTPHANNFLVNSSLDARYTEIDTANRWMTLEYDYDYAVKTHKKYDLEGTHGISIAARCAGMLADLGDFRKSNEIYLSILSHIRKHSLHGSQGLLFPAETFSLGSLSRNYAEMEEFSTAKHYSLAAMETVSHLNFSPKKIFPLVFGSIYLLRQERFLEADKYLQEAYILSQKFDIGMTYPFVCGNYGYCVARLGRVQEGIELLKKVIIHMDDRKILNRKSLYCFYLAIIYDAESDQKKSSYWARLAYNISLENLEHHTFEMVSKFIARECIPKTRKIVTTQLTNAS